MRIRSCRKQGPRPNLPRRPGGPRQRHPLAQRVKKMGIHLLCLVMFVMGGWTGIQMYQLAHQGLGELFTLREIRTSGLSYLSRPEVLARLALSGNETLFTVSPSALKAELEAHPWIKAADVRREPFHSLSVEVHERRPAAVLQDPSGSLLLDHEGAVLTSQPETATLVLPVLTGIDLGRLQEKNPAAGRTAQQGIKLAALLSQSYEGRPQIDLHDPQNAVGYVQGLRFEFGAASFEEKWARYQQIEPNVRSRLVQVGAESGGAVDLRYPGKVIIRERG